MAPLVGTQMYLSTLEATKAWTYSQAESATPNQATAAAAANFAAGGTASLITQTVIVPVDVISQRLMVAGGFRVQGVGVR